MSFFSKLFNGGVSGVIDSLGNVIDRFTLSKEEKVEFQSEMQSRLMQIEKELEETYRTEINARAEIIKAEMAQGDKYTKRARPTIIYAGLLFMFIVFVLVPVIAYMSGVPSNELPEFILPDGFWYAWGTVVGVYGAGRSAEKMGIVNQITQIATGSGVYKVNKKKSVEG